MNHNQLPSTDNPEAPATVESLERLRDRIDTFVFAHCPAIPYPEGTHMFDTGVEPPRPLITDDAPMVDLVLPRSLLERIAPEAVQRMQADGLTLSTQPLTYEYMGDGAIPAKVEDIDADDVHDIHWINGRGSSVYVHKSDPQGESTFYKLSVAGDFTRESELEEDFDLTSENSSRISEQERADIAAILDGLESLDARELAAAMHVKVSFG